jgi:hypothetical protein
VPSGMSGNRAAASTASAAAIPKHPVSTGTGWNRSDSQPPIGRITTASTTNPRRAVRGVGRASP